MLCEIYYAQCSCINLIKIVVNVISNNSLGQISASKPLKSKTDQRERFSH